MSKIKLIALLILIQQNLISAPDLEILADFYWAALLDDYNQIKSILNNGFNPNNLPQSAMEKIIAKKSLYKSLTSDKQKFIETICNSSRNLYEIITVMMIKLTNFDTELNQIRILLKTYGATFSDEFKNHHNSYYKIYNLDKKYNNDLDDLLEAVNDKNPFAVYDILNKGIDPNQEPDCNLLVTALYTEGLPLSIVYLLLDFSADPNSDDIIEHAVKLNNLKFVELLLKYGAKAKPNLLFLTQDPKMIGLLLSYKIDPNAGFQDGDYRPLHATENPDCFKQLLLYGADPDIKSDYFETPREYTMIADVDNIINSAKDTKNKIAQIKEALEKKLPQNIINIVSNYFEDIPKRKIFSLP